jgi:hypothetical protein
MTQWRLAKAIDIDPSHINRFRCCQNLPRLEAFARISMALGWSDAYILYILGIREDPGLDRQFRQIADKNTSLKHVQRKKQLHPYKR